MVDTIRLDHPTRKSATREVTWGSETSRPVDREALWLRGGFPESLLAADDAASRRWRLDFKRSDLDLSLPGGDLWAIEIQRGLAPKPGRCIHQACADFGLPLWLARPCRSETLWAYDAALWAFPRLSRVAPAGLRDRPWTRIERLGRRAKRQGSHGNDNE